MHSSCEESSNGHFRYVLERIWGTNGRIVIFVMLNPSIANGFIDDPTIRRCIAFARAWGYDGIRVINLVAYRATDPDDMYQWLKDAPREAMTANVRVVRAEITRADVKLIVCAWGTPRPALWDYARQMQKLLRSQRVLHCIKINGTGTPAHPLYLRKDLHPIEFI